MTKIEIRKNVLLIVAYCNNSDCKDPYNIYMVNTYDIAEITQLTYNVDQTKIILKLKGSDVVSEIKCDNELQASEYYRKIQDIMLENCLKKERS